MQIDTTQNGPSHNNEAPAIQKERVRAIVEKFMTHRETQKRVEKLIGKSQNRLQIEIDELRAFTTGEPDDHSG